MLLGKCCSITIIIRGKLTYTGFVIDIRTCIYYSSSCTTMRANSFLLSLCSPVLQKMICGSFIENKIGRIDIHDVDGRTFEIMLNLWCGNDEGGLKSLGHLQRLGAVADRFQVIEVQAALEETMIRELSVKDCAELLVWSGRIGFKEAEGAAMRLAVNRFEEVAATASFMTIDEDVMGCLLDNDQLVVKNEEVVWEALVAWMLADDGPPRGRELLRKIRFPLMEKAYLASTVPKSLPADWIEGLVAEALSACTAREAGATFVSRLLGQRALIPRRGLSVRWEDYADGGERRLEGHTEGVSSVVECAGRLCSASWDGSIRVWNGATLEHERCLRADGAAGVDTLTVWEGRLVSGHADGALRVWDVLAGACEQVLEGHALFIDSLAVCGSHLASGSGDRSIKLWAMSAAAPWPCERTLTGHVGWVVALAAWRGKVLSGSSDSTVRVWDTATGTHDATLAGHGLTVNGLAVRGDRVWSSSLDGTVREWAAGTWAALRTVDACGGDASLRPRCLAVSGGQLVCGSGALGVWDLESLARERTLRQPAGDAVQALAVVGAQVWAGVGNKVVVWGRR